jgi:anthranilate phosphoribosyltransferase
MSNFSYLIEQAPLEASTARELLYNLTQQHYNEAQMAAILTVFLMRGTSIQELRGFREAMLDLCIPLNTDLDIIDVCGTGGDGKDTFNISTLAAFVVASAGQPVAKHGNYGVSSVCGSSNVMQALGVTLNHDVQLLQQQLNETGICFLHAPLFHPAMKHVAPVRKALEVKTFFNMLGPMVNPAKPQKQLMGVFNLDLARKIAYLYQEEEKKFAIVHSLDGYDEISLTGTFKVYTHLGDFLLEPEDLGLPRLQPEDLYGGATVEEAAVIFYNVLKGNGTDAQRAVVIANAALGLFCAEQSDTLLGAVELAAKCLDNGKALKTFEAFKLEKI